MAADLIAAKGRIYTMDDACPFAEAIALRNGQIVAVGHNSDIAKLAGRGTQIVDLGNRAVIPGLIDSHVHLMEFALRLRRADLAGASTLEEALCRVQRAAESAAPGEWIVGGGFDSNRWTRLPNRSDLDGVASDRPVFLASKDMHSGWVNSVALRLAGIDRDTPNPPDGEILRDPLTGEPTGILREWAVSPVMRAAGMLESDGYAGQTPARSPAQCDAALEEAQAILLSKGLTGLHTPQGPTAFGALQRLHARGRLKVRVWHHLRRENLEDARRLGVRTGFGDAHLRVGHLKLFMDGALGSQTDHTLEPHYESGGDGIEALSRDELRTHLEAASEAGIAVAIHAIGDAANRAALDALEDTAPLWRPAGLRPRIEHLQLLHPNDAHRLGQIGVVASMQPSHQPSDIAIADRYWGPKRTPLAYAWRTVLESGAVLAFGSDCPVESIDPLPGMYAAVTRQTADGHPLGGWHPEQRLTPAQALRAFTLGPAYASSEERVKGSLTPGKLADFVILSVDPFCGPPELFLQTKVEATVIGGEVVFGEL